MKGNHRRSGAGGFVRQSSSSSVAALLAMLSGLLLDVALATRFGAGRQSDSFFVAARIPIGLSALLITVSTQTLVPLFTREQRANGRAGMTQFASRMLTAVVGAGLVLWGLASLLARPLVAATAPGLSTQQLALAASMVSLMFLVVPLVAAAETVRAALNASYSFVLPAAMNLFMNGLAAGIILFSHGHDIRMVAWAYVAGAAFQLLVISVLAWFSGVRIRPSWHVLDPRVHGAFRLSRRPTVSSLLNLGNRVVEQLLMSFLPAGSITVLSYGQRLISALGGGIFFRPVTVTLLPRLADAEHAGDRAEVGALVRRGLKFVLAISLPLTAFTVALAEPAIRLVFHRGNFGPTAVHMLALTLVIYGASLVGSGVQRILLAPFYARLDTKTPLRNTFYGVVIDLLLLLPCVALFGRHSPQGVLGVALAYSITQYFIVGHAWFRLRASVPLRVAALLGFTTKAVLAGAVSAAGMLWLVHRLDLATMDDRVRLLLSTVGVTVVGALVMALVGGGALLRSRYLTQSESYEESSDVTQPADPSDPRVPHDGGAGLASTGVEGANGGPGGLSSTESEQDARTARTLMDHPPAVVLAGPSASATDRGSAAARILGAVVIVVAAVATGLLSVRTVDRTELVLPVAGLAGLTLVILGLRRFEWFVLAVLALRTVVDVTKAGPGSNQLPSSTAATASAVSSGPAASALAILFIVVASIWLLGRSRSRALSTLKVTDGVFLLFVFSCLVSVVGAVNRVATITETARIIAAVLMFVVLERLLTSLAHVKRVLIAAFVALAAPVGMGVVQALTGQGRFVTGGVSRVVGTFLHPNTFGFFLSMFMLMSIALYRHCAPRTRLAIVAVLVVCGTMLVLTYSRGSWIAFVLGLMVIGVLQSRLVFAWMAAAGLGVLALLPAVVARIADLGAGSSVTGSAGNSLTWRFDYWASVIQLNHANPVTGIGLKGTRFITDQSKAPHNDFLRAYAETGALGLLAFVAVLVAFGVVARQAVRRAAPGLARGVAVGFVAVLIAYLVDSLGDNLMSEVVVLWYFYAFAACAVAVARLGPDAAEPTLEPLSPRHARPDVRVST